MPRLKRAIFFLLFFAPLPALAQSVIHRCVGADGSPVYSDQPCAAIGATSIAPPSASTTAAPGSPTTGMLCAKDLAELREGMARAFATHDANRVGALVLWSGYGSNGAVDSIQRLGDLVKQPLLSLQGDESSGLEVVTGRTGQTRRAHFGIAHESGCLWLRPPG